MKLLLCRPRGFCAGVVRAIQTVERALELYGPPIYVKHAIVHNRHVVEDLKKKGALFIEELEEVPEGSYLIYSAHGVSPEVRKQAKNRNLIEIDATCGLVTKVHSAVKRYVALGYQVLLIGHKNHVEIQGVFGIAPHAIHLIESAHDVHSLHFPPDQKLFYATQTTLSLYDLQDIVSLLKERFAQIETLPSSTLCYATTNRQMAVREIRSQCDLILVIGDPMSSNSKRLVEVAKSSYLISDASEIYPEMLRDVSRLGLTAGASTPESIVQECISALKTHGVTEVEEFILLEEDVLFALPKFTLHQA